jgi:hypothetical protein
MKAMLERIFLCVLLQILNFAFSNASSYYLPGVIPHSYDSEETVSVPVLCALLVSLLFSCVFR